MSYPNAKPSHAPKGGPTDYSQLPLLRKGGTCSAILIAPLILAMLAFLGVAIGGSKAFLPVIVIGCIATFFGLIAVCATMLTGEVYTKAKSPSGTLVPRSLGNKSWP